MNKSLVDHWGKFNLKAREPSKILDLMVQAQFLVLFYVNRLTGTQNTCERITMYLQPQEKYILPRIMASFSKMHRNVS